MVPKREKVSRLFFCISAVYHPGGQDVFFPLMIDQNILCFRFIPCLISWTLNPRNSLTALHKKVLFQKTIRSASSLLLVVTLLLILGQAFIFILMYSMNNDVFLWLVTSFFKIIICATLLWYSHMSFKNDSQNQINSF